MPSGTLYSPLFAHEFGYCVYFPKFTEMNRADNIQAIYPLSPLQEGMLFHTVIDPGSGVYVEQSAYMLGGELDPEYFRAAWQAVINRHAVLRTAFVWRGLERMAQVVFRDIETPLRFEDWRSLNDKQQAEKLRQYMEEDRRQGFDIAKAPLLRLLLVRLGNQSYQIVISYHHALLDGWSYMMVLKEMARTYEALARGTQVQLPEPRQYRDFIRWLDKQDSAKAEAFWRERLRGMTEATLLPFDLGIGSAGTVSIGDDEIGLTFSRDLTASLMDFAKRQHLSLNTLVQGAWALVLSRSSGEDDVVFGATVAGRPAELEGVEYMVGLFINTIPIRVRVEAASSVLDWLRHVQSERMADYEFQHTRLVDIQKWTTPTNGQVLFDSLLVFENYPVDLFERRHGEERGTLDIEKGVTRELVSYPLCLVVCPGDRLRIQIAYSSARFSRESIEQVGRWLEHVLESFVQNPHASLRDIGLLQPNEQQVLLQMSSGEQVSRRENETAHGLIELQARAQPERTAVIADEVSISFGELNAWANRLARHICKRGIKPQGMVGVFLDRGADMIVALLAILKAGAVYVPLDPGYPVERLTYIAKDCALEALITTSDIMSRAPAHAERIIALDLDGPQIAQYEVTDLELAVQPEALAYIIYTSGSTGQPKGIAIPHSALAGHCLGWIDFCDLTPRDRVLQFASLCFDASVEQIFPTLAAGACVVVRERLPWSTGEFIRHAVDSALTVVDLPSAYFAECTRNWEQAKLLLSKGALRLVSVGGDKVSAQGLARWQEMSPHLRLVNAYGPTEATVTATAGDIMPDAPPDNVPIGRPLQNRTAYVLDSHLRLVPFGMAGELYLGGEGLARCYWGKPALTAAHFVPDPFSSTPGARLYRTGDRTRLRRDGAMEFLGRADDQVKIRGYRIEPGEIERAVKEHSAVSGCIALPYDSPAGRELVAYVVCKGGQSIDEEELRSHLAARLPRFVIPRAIVFLDSFPMLPNDSIDRKKLPAPTALAGTGQGARVSPRNAYEEMLSELWVAVLAIEPPGITDDFFIIGGHSLDATRLVSRIFDTFGVELPLRVIFERPTIAGLAVMIAEIQSASLAEEDAEFLDEIESVS
jgi:amino acid adenylation domain-containing protein